MVASCVTPKAKKSVSKAAICKAREAAKATMCSTARKELNEYLDNHPDQVMQILMNCRAGFFDDDTAQPESRRASPKLNKQNTHMYLVPAYFLKKALAQMSLAFHEVETKEMESKPNQSGVVHELFYMATASGKHTRVPTKIKEEFVEWAINRYKSCGNRLDNVAWGGDYIVSWEECGTYTLEAIAGAQPKVTHLSGEVAVIDDCKPIQDPNDWKITCNYSEVGAKLIGPKGLAIVLQDRFSKNTLAKEVPEPRSDDEGAPSAKKATPNKVAKPTLSGGRQAVIRRPLKVS